MCRLGSLDSGQTLVASSYEHRDELLGLKIQILWNVILCWLLNRSALSLSLSFQKKDCRTDGKCFLSQWQSVKTWTGSLYLKWAKSSI